MIDGKRGRDNGLKHMVSKEGTCACKDIQRLIVGKSLTDQYNLLV